MIRIQIVSNGYGEDLIASKLIQAFKLESSCFDVFPLVGEGNAFKKIGVIPKITQKEIPSGGFLLKWKDVLSDVKAGLIPQVLQQRKLIKSFKADFQIVVGDVFCLWMATANKNVKTIFLPTAKSERSIPHYGFEMRFIRYRSHLVFPRDQETHQRMLSAKINSKFLGNPMFDNLQSDLGSFDQNIIGILPGSRKEAIGNLSKILCILPRLSLKTPFLFKLALASSITYKHLKAAIDDLPWKLIKNDQGYHFQYTRKKITIDISYQFMDVLHQSSIIIGLAGTANEQAMFAKRHVISFIGTGPQSTKKRFLQQGKLIDGATFTFIDASETNDIATKMSDVINHIDLQWRPLSEFKQNVAKEIVNGIQSKFF